MWEEWWGAGTGGGEGMSEERGERGGRGGSVVALRFVGAVLFDVFMVLFELVGLSVLLVVWRKFGLVWFIASFC